MPNVKALDPDYEQGYLVAEKVVALIAAYLPFLAYDVQIPDYAGLRDIEHVPCLEGSIAAGFAPEPRC